MIGPDQSLSEFPSWLWPYIDVGRLAHAEGRPVDQSATAISTPEAVTAVRLGALIAAATFKQIAARIVDEKIRGELLAAATATLAADGDDICPPPRRVRWPWPFPPRRIELAELAGRVALAAASTGDKTLGQELGQVAAKLAEQAREA